MDNKKDNEYYIKKIVTDIEFIISNTKGLTEEQLAQNEVLLDSVMFRLIQISENSDRLTSDFKAAFNQIPWRAIKGMRNRIVHDYGYVDLTVIYNTIVNDLPPLVGQLRDII